MLLIGVLRMVLLHSKSSRIICALFALFVITGDLVADAIHEATGACVTESQTGNCDSCPACAGCAIHAATALAVDSGGVIIPHVGAGSCISETIEQCAIGSQPGIDHPPQLS
jgi:hypothetical protein